MSKDLEILIVEHNVIESEHLKHILEAQGHKVAVEHDGESALDHIRSRNPQIVISGVMLPQLDGYALCQAIKADEDLKHIPVILLTSLSDTKDIIRGLECGADNFVTKPYDEELLTARIEYIVLNRELRMGAGTQTGLEIIFGGEKYSITPERQQMVDLLISTYETAVQKNLQLVRVEKELNRLNEHLEEEVKVRTAELEEEIAERRAAEAELKKQQKFFRDVIDANPNVIFVKDEEGKYSLVNKAMAELYATTVESLVGRASADFVNEEDAERTFLQEEEIKLTSRPHSIPEEPLVDHKTGDVRWFQMIKTPLVSSDGQVRQLLVVATDISQRKLAEDALRKSEDRLQQAQKMEAIGNLAGGVAHDFNNLLTAILGYAQLALHNLQPDDPAHAFLTEVEKAGNRAAVLTRQLLAFGRRQLLERRTINLNDTIAEILKLLKRIIGEDVEVRVKAARGLSAVSADPAQIEQVVMNLAVNARDAMPQGGNLTIETSNVELDEAYALMDPNLKPGAYVEIRVSDTGTGMDIETQSHIFEPFFTTKDIGKGTGLGLAMVYGIVKQHDGHINVYSEVGCGTTFKVFLPVDQRAVEAEASAIHDPLAGGTETILVAEDEETLRTLAKTILEHLGYTVLLASNGKDAVDVYTEHREQIDLLLMDVVMPRMGGSEASQLISEMGGTQPVIFMTGYSSETVRNRFVMDRFVDLNGMVIHKPYSVVGLGRRVREVLDDKKQKEADRVLGSACGRTVEYEGVT